MRRRKQQPDSTLTGVFDGLKADYAAAKSSRFRRWRTGNSALGSGADYHYRSQSDFLRMLELARDMDRNDAIGGVAVDRAVTNTVHVGFKVDPQTGSDALDKRLKELWVDWAGDPERCDLSGEWAFPDMERFVCRHMLVDGDIVALPHRSGALELVEAHRLRTPSNTKRNVVHGVLLNNHRRRMEYWFTQDEMDPSRALAKVSDIKPYKVRDALGRRQIFHIYHPKRVSQTRGVSAFAPITDTLGMFEDINFAKLVQQQIVSCIGFFRNRALGFEGGDAAALGDQTLEALPEAGTSRTIEGMAPGLEITGAAGETLSAFQPNVPNPEFFLHIKLMLQLVAVNLGLPLQVMLLDASETNFSGWRGALDQAKKGFDQNQEALIRRFHLPVYLWKVRQWLHESAELRKPAGYQIGPDGHPEKVGEPKINVFKHRWTRPAWPYIEPLKDAKADDLRIKSNQTSQRRLQAERGRDYDDIVVEIVEDRAALVREAIRTAKAINAEDTEAMVDWRELAAFDTVGRKKGGGSRGMEDLARAVRAGVPIGEAEARVTLGLPAAAAEGENLLRFNDQDVLAYHIESGVLTINETRERLLLPPVPWGDVPVRRKGIAPVKQTGSREGDSEDDEDEKEEEEN